MTKPTRVVNLISPRSKPQLNERQTPFAFVSERLGRATRRKSEDDAPSDDLDPAFLAAISSSYLPSQPGCRQGVYIPGDEGDDGDIPKVTDSSVLGDMDEDYDIFVIDTLSPFLDSIDPAAGPQKSPGRWSFKRMQSGTVRSIGTKLSDAFRSKKVDDSDSDGSCSPNASVDVLAPLSPHTPQLARFSFASTASTGTLDRYLVQRQAQRRVLESSLRPGVGISIVTYEREGSWLVEHDLKTGHGFVCPLLTCDAHQASST